MAAVVRIKRLLNDDPLDVVILNCKRRKIEETPSNELELTTVLKFAGTTNSRDEDFLKLIKKSTKTDLENDYKKHDVDLSAKLKSQKAADTKNSRFQIVSHFRSNFEQTNDLTVVEVETQFNDSVPIKCDDSNYVYDLYYTSSDDLGELDEFVSIHPFNDHFVDLRDTNGDSDNDSDDSNAENYWKNDYPDESDVESVGEEDMIQAMARVDLSDLSSDEGDEKYVYSDESEQGGRYHNFMAKYEAKEEASGIDHNFYFGDIDENDNDNY